jgi:alpha-glucosidase
MLFAAVVAGADPVAESIGDRIVRFYASPRAQSAALPSLCLVSPLSATGPAPADFPVRPEFATIYGRNGVRITIARGTSLYGTGEVSGPLLRNGRAITLWNTDAFGYDRSTEALYQSHPWVLAVRADGTAFGVLFDTGYRGRLDLRDGIVFFADGPSYPVIVIERDSPQEVVRTLADLTGHMPMPPLWALGYHQCRWSYTPASRVREVARGFRERKIPCDVIWMDIDYMDGFRSFTFNPSTFSDPAALNRDLHDEGFHTVWMIDPGIKKDPGYFVYHQGTALDAWVKRADGETYVGDVWPGACVFPDFTRARVRTWWAGLYKDYLATGIDGVWNDMNEPSIFHVDSKTMPLDNLHDADPDLGGPGNHQRYHNVYGMEMVRATREGVAGARPDRRPFVLTRSSHLGGQRYAATWTGDNTADWNHLADSIPMILNLGLSGQPFSGPDIGGFAGNGDGALFARWMGIGALLPFARGHSAKGTIDKEPWAFGPEVEATCRRALERRYRLLPYLYTLFHEASATGLPVARPLFFADPAETGHRSEDNAFLLGGDLLVAARVRPGKGLRARVPAGRWRRFDFGPEDGADPDLPSLYLRNGAIVATGPVQQHVGEKPLDPVTLLVRLDAGGRAQGTLYEDAGDGFGNRDGEYRVVRYRAEAVGDSVRVTSSVVDGRWPLPERRLAVRVLFDRAEASGEGPEGGPVTVAGP